MNRSRQGYRYQSGILAGKDAFKLDYPFFELPNIIGSPHIADHVPGSMPHATRRALENVRNFLMGNELRGVLNREDYLP